MTIPGEKDYLSREYDNYIYDSTQELFQNWLYEKEGTTADKLELDIQEKTGGAVNRLLGAEEFADGHITLFFEYIPDLYNHPVEVFGKPIKDIPDTKILQKYVERVESEGPGSKPLVLMHNNGLYINCIKVFLRHISPEILEQNMTVLKGKAQENWDRILNKTTKI